MFEKEAKTGLVIGNATLSAAVTGKGRMFGRILYNPPYFEYGKNSLREAGECGFSFACDGTVIRDSQIHWDVKDWTYPRYCAKGCIMQDIEVSVLTYAPLSAKDEEIIFMPCVATQYRINNQTESEKCLDISLTWNTTKEALRESYGIPGKACWIGEGHCIVESGAAFISTFGSSVCTGSANANGTIAITSKVVLPPRSEIQMVFLIGIFEQQHRFRKNFNSASEVCRFVQMNYSRIKDEFEDFIAVIPHTGDDQIYKYTRWYMQAAILLTKSAKNGEVITMGYTELNQRDSFWTSFLHVSLWSGLEKEIIRLSARWMREDGKIPTTILPLIERNFDVDINEYFCLRIARYYRYHKEKKFLEEMYESYRRSVDFILTQDRDGDGLPEQDTPDNPECFWGDWKDVPGVIGRKLSPHFCLLWLAVLKEGAYLAEEMDDIQTKERYIALYTRAYERINLGVSEGGLWLNDHYVEVWYDGRAMTEVLHDQMVGFIWNVIPESRVQLLYDAVSRGENQFGIRETFPYRQESFGYRAGEYHNGGIWPYLMFCDIMGRYIHGRQQDAERLIRKIGYFDLELPGDYAPNEFLYGDTGENAGMEIQGWSSALYGAMSHGAFQIRHSGDREITVKVNIRNRDFETILVLPERFGRVRISRKEGILSVSGVNKGYYVNVQDGEQE